MDEKKRRAYQPGVEARIETAQYGREVPARSRGTLQQPAGGLPPVTGRPGALAPRGPLPGMAAPGPGEEIPIDTGENLRSGTGREMPGAAVRNDDAKQPIGPKELKEFTLTLQKYKTGKAHLESRVIAAENWWKLRNSCEEEKETLPREGFKSRSAWLHNVITSKHADAMEAYPEPNILPREEGDREEARELTAILPCILEQNEFEQVYNDTMYRKLKTGTGVYMVVWDPDKLGGLGDIDIKSCDLLNLFWEPGVEDIQNSPYFFHTALSDTKELESQYPQLKGKGRRGAFRATEFLWDDVRNTEDKTTVIDVYYHRFENGRRVLHYCKYVGDVVLYSTENQDARKRGLGMGPGLPDGETGQGVLPAAAAPGTGMPGMMPGTPAAPMTQQAEHHGVYDHGLYPFVFDPLFPVEGSPCGYGFVDICMNPQTAIDLMRGAVVKNTMVGATPRYFVRQDGGVNEEEFKDITNELVHVQGSLDERMLKLVDFKQLSGNYLNALNMVIQELRETSGNTETATGSTSAGVTAASAIAALQEASGKGSRDSSKGSYRAFGRLVNLCIELVRQFYDVPRKFRITGESGQMGFTTYDNSRLKPMPQAPVGGVSMGLRMPVFDIKVAAQKKNAYTRMSQNELALQLFGAGFMNPQIAEQAIITLSMMEFEGKDGLVQKIQAQATLVQRLQTAAQLAISLARMFAPEQLPAIAQQLGMDPGAMGATAGGQTGAAASGPRGRTTADGERENGMVTKARERANAASQPEGGGA